MRILSPSGTQVGRGAVRAPPAGPRGATRGVGRRGRQLDVRGRCERATTRPSVLNGGFFFSLLSIQYCRECPSPVILRQADVGRQAKGRAIYITQHTYAMNIYMLEAVMAQRWSNTSDIAWPIACPGTFPSPGKERHLF